MQMQSSWRVSARIPTRVGKMPFSLTKVMSFLKSKHALQAGVILAVIAAVAIVGFQKPEGKWVCRDNVWQKEGKPVGPPPAEACGGETEKIGESIPTSTIFALPEVPREIEYCKNHGGKIEYRKNGAGAEYAVCVFLGGRECEVNSYISEECPQNGALITGQYTEAARYCITMGGEYRPVRDKNYKTPRETGNCVFLTTGKTCKAADFWMGKCEKKIAVVAPINPVKPAITPINEELRSVPFSGEMSSEDALIKTYGANPEEVFKKQPSLLTLVRRFIPNFEVAEMRQGFKTVVATLPDKRKFVVFSGCSYDGCIGTVKVAAYDTKKRALYLLAENDSRSEVNLYGAIDDGVKSVLLRVYFSLW